MTLRLATWALGCALALAAPAAAQTELRVGVTTFLGELTDPIHTGLASLVHNAPVFDFLVAFDDKMNFVPGLAERWTVSPDGKTYTFFLRRNVKWHSGETFTSADVTNHLQRLEKGTAPFIAGFRNSIASVSAPDDHTVVFELKQPFPDFLAHLSPGVTALGAITPKAYIDRVGEAEFKAKPVGTGPWRMIDRRAGQYMLFERVPGHPFRPTPAYERLRLLQVPEPSTRVAMLQRGEVNLIDIEPDSIKAVSDGGNQVLEIPSSVLPFIGFVGIWSDKAKAKRSPVQIDNVKVRHALSMAIDRQELVEFLMAGRGASAVTFPTFPGGFGNDPAWDKANAVPFDPAAAKRLLAEAGYPNGFKLRIHTSPLPNAPWIPKMVEVIVGYWKAIGVETEIVNTEATVFIPKLYALADDVVGDAFTYRASKSVFPVGQSQTYFAANGRAQVALLNWDADHAAVASENDMAKREEGFRRLTQRAKESYAVLPVFYASALYGASKGLRNWRPIDGWPQIGFAYDHFLPPN